MLPLPRHMGTVDGDPLCTLELSEGDLWRSMEIEGDLGIGRGPGSRASLGSASLGSASLNRPQAIRA